MTKAMIVRNEMDIMTLGDVLAKSGYFSDSTQAAQAVVKVMAGQELGFGPVTSMTGIHIIQGKVALGSNILAAAIKRSGRYNYLVQKLDNDGCTIEFYENGKAIGKSEFTKADAQSAGVLGKDNWKKFPRNMYFSRALSNGQKWFCPDVGNGAPLYTPEELGAEIDGETGEIIEMPIDIIEPTNGNNTPKPTNKSKPFRFPSTEAQKFYNDCQAKTGNKWDNEYHFMQSMENNGLTWVILNDDTKKVKAFEKLTDQAIQENEPTLDEVFGSEPVSATGTGAKDGAHGELS